MKIPTRSRRIALLCVALLPALAQAHPGHDAGGSFVAGVIHPLTGVDHLLALVAAGALGWRMGGRARIQVPLMFLVALQAGILAGYAGVQVFAGEMIIA